MRFRIVDTFLITSLLGRKYYKLRTLTLWQRIKPAVETELTEELQRIIIGPTPKEVIYVLDTGIAERDIGPQALAATGLTDTSRAVIYLLPRRGINLGTLLHEYVHFLVSPQLSRLVPQISKNLYSLLHDYYSGNYTERDVEDSLRANITYLDECFAYLAEFDFVGSVGRENPLDMYYLHVDYLSRALARDLSILPIPGTVRQLVDTTIKHTYMQHIRPLLDKSINHARFVAYYSRGTTILSTIADMANATIVGNDDLAAFQFAKKLFQLVIA